MSALMLFVILLIVGFVFLVSGMKMEGKCKLVLVIVGLILCLFAAFGLFTVFL